MTRLFLLPGQNYAGPGNPLDIGYRAKYKPTNALDRAAYRHDWYYAGMGPKAYFVYNKGDARFLRDTRGLGGFNAHVARGYFLTKRGISYGLQKIRHPFSKPKVFDSIYGKRAALRRRR